MKKTTVVLLALYIKIGLSQTNCFYIKSYTNPLLTQINNLSNNSIVEINNRNVDVQFLKSNEFPEFGFVAGLDRNKNIYEFSVNYSKYGYKFISNINYGTFKDQKIRSFSANSIGIRLSYGRKLIWSTSLHCLIEISFPIKEFTNMPDNNISSTYNSLGETIKIQEQLSENFKDVFLTPELYFNTEVNSGVYLRYGLKFHAFDPYLLYTQKIEYANSNGNTEVDLDMRLGHERIGFFLGIGYKFEFKT